GLRGVPASGVVRPDPTRDRRVPAGLDPIEAEAALEAQVPEQRGGEQREERLSRDLGVAAGVGLAQQQGQVRAAEGVGPEVEVVSALGLPEQLVVLLEVVEHRVAEGAQPVGRLPAGACRTRASTAQVSSACSSGSARRSSPSARAVSAWPTGTSSSRACAPAVRRTLRSSACAHTAPNRPVVAPTTNEGLPFSAVVARGREAQSIAFLSAPGTEPLYSGVAMRSASAPAMASRSARTASGAGSTSRSSS